MKSLMRLWAFLLVATYFATLALPAVALATTTPSAPQPSCTISIVPSVVEAGSSATLHWNSANATGGAITNVGNVGPSGSAQILPPTSRQITTYIGSFTGPGGTANCSASVQISYSAVTGASTDIVTPNPVPVNPGTSVTNTGGGTQPSLVQCGTGPDIAGATSCQACNLAQLVQNIINFCIGLSIPIAAVLFAWAGILYFSSGANPTNKETAKKIFSSALIGFLIAITSWLVINTLLHALLDGGKVFKQGNWFTIECSTNRPVTGDINQVINSILPGVNTTPLAVSTSNSFNSNFNAANSQFTPTCGSGYQLTNDVDGNPTCWNPDTNLFQSPGYNSSNAVSNAQLQQQIVDACATYGLNSAQCASVGGFLGAESSGGTKCNTSTTGAVGCFQVLPTTACSINPNIDGCSTCSKTTGGSLGAGCAAVAQAIADPVLNTNLGVNYIAQQYNTFGSCGAAAAAYYAGPGAVKQANGNVSNMRTPNYPGAISPLQYATRVCGN